VAQPLIKLGLMTGNMPASAKIKLQHFGLWDYFLFGIFGDQAAHRPELAGPALAKVAEQHPLAKQRSSIVVIGDTPLDCQLALAMDVPCLAVCTGGFDRQQLQLAGATWVLPDLADTDRVFELLLK
jgi:phosphoglycolate phosphatase-like HAD superfamily hydrolase